MFPNRVTPLPSHGCSCVGSFLRTRSVGLRKALTLFCLLLIGVAASSCTSSHRRPTHTPADEARNRVQFLQSEFRAGRGGVITPDQIRLIERMPYRSTGPQQIPRVLREGIPEPSVPLGERRSLLELYGGLEAGVKVHETDTPPTREDESIDPHR